MTFKCIIIVHFQDHLPSCEKKSKQALKESNKTLTEEKQALKESNKKLTEESYSLKRQLAEAVQTVRVSQAGPPEVRNTEV